MATKHLLAEYGGFQAQVGEERLGNWRQQRHQVIGTLARLRIVAELGDVQLRRHVGGERPAAFVRRLHGQQHATDIRMHDDRVCRLVLGLRA